MPYHFNLPTIIDLTVPQQAALNDPGAISVSGGPGTGKSVVSLWRHIRNYEIGNKRSLLLTYTVTLAKYLSSAAAGINKEAGNNIKKTFWWIEHEQADFDEIIVDEAQDITSEKYDILRARAPEITYGADDQQIIYPRASTTQAQLEEMFPDNEPYILDENFRNSLQIMRFVRAALPAMLIPEITFERLEADDRTGNKPIVMLTGGSDAKQDKAILDLINTFMSGTHNIGIFHPFVGEVIRLFEMIEAAGIPCSKYVNEDANLERIEGVHVTTFKSCKGTEFDTVIVPDFQSMRYYIRTNRIVEDKDYYVTFTRAKRNLFLISANDPTFIDASTYDKEPIT